MVDKATISVISNKKDLFLTHTIILITAHLLPMLYLSELQDPDCQSSTAWHVAQSLWWGKGATEGAVPIPKWVVLRSDCTLLFTTCWLELVMKLEGGKEGEKEVRMYLAAENRKYVEVNTDSYHNSTTVEEQRATQFMPFSKQLAYSLLFYLI